MPMQSPYGLRSPGRDVDCRPLVSVIIAFLDANQFLEEAIESVLAQGYKQWELLLVDDGSTDRSTETALRYAVRYPEKVRYFDHAGHRNLGVAASRNLAMFNARGQYIALLDADDVWMPQSLERQVTMLESHPQVGMVYGATEWWYSWTGGGDNSRRDFVDGLGVETGIPVQPPSLLVPIFFRQEAAVPCTCSVMVRREAVEQVGHFEDGFRGPYASYEDQAFFAKIFLSAPVLASAECWSRYRQHTHSVCSITKRKAQEYAARLFFMEWLAQYICSLDVVDAEIWNELRREMRRCRHPFSSRLLTGARRSLKPAVVALKVLWTWESRT